MEAVIRADALCKTVNLSKAPPVNRFRNPKMFLHQLPVAGLTLLRSPLNRNKSADPVHCQQGSGVQELLSQIGILIAFQCS